MGRVKLKNKQGKGISVEKFNALGQKVRKFMNSLKGMKLLISVERADLQLQDLQHERE